MQTPAYWDEACRHLGADPVLARLIAQYPGMTLQSRGNPFVTLARSITGQQISVKAAESIWQRLLLAAGSADPEPETILDLTAETLRGCGFSLRKAEYLHDLARHAQAGQLDPARWQTMDDEAIIAELCAVRGIGRWSAQMFLMFYLLRPDVLPLDDIGLIKGVARHYFSDERPSRHTLRELAAAWQPWRSVAVWYLWRSLDPVPVAY